MSRERFEWLQEIGAEVIATPGCESNVKEIYDKCWELRRTRPDVRDLQPVRGIRQRHLALPRAPAAPSQEVFAALAGAGQRLAAYVSATGSAGTIAAGDFLQTAPPAAARWSPPRPCSARPCCSNGFGGHRIEGIGDKHVPWIHNVRNTDVRGGHRRRGLHAPAAPVQRARRADAPAAGRGRAGRRWWRSCRCWASPASATCWRPSRPPATSSWTQRRRHLHRCTDSVELYQSRLAELTAGARRLRPASRRPRPGRAACWASAPTTSGADLPRPQGHPQPQVLHLGRAAAARSSTISNALWEDGGLWARIFAQPARWDEMIDEFNRETGVLANL